MGISYNRTLQKWREQKYLQAEASLRATACKKAPHAVYLRYKQFTCENT